MQQSIRVLLVDDQPVVRAGVRAILNSAPDIDIVGEASSGEEAIGMLERSAPNVVVMDHEMPGGGGLAATQQIARGAVAPRVLVLSMHSDDQRLLDALSAGATGYVTKDVGCNELLRAVRQTAEGEPYLQPHAVRVLASSIRPPSTPTETDRALREFRSLSKREQLVLRLVAEGRTGPEIGKGLGIASKTVDTYRHRIHQKIGLVHRSDYVRFALLLDLLPKPSSL